MQSKEYIHYGADSYDPSLIEPVENSNFINKPISRSLWASPVDCDNSWKNYVIKSKTEKYFNIEKSFKFTLSPEANILSIRSKDMTGVPLRNFFEKAYNTLDMYTFLNFEKISEMGYDGIEVEIKKVNGSFYLWDCDSIVIFNPDVVIVQK